MSLCNTREANILLTRHETDRTRFRLQLSDLGEVYCRASDPQAIYPPFFTPAYFDDATLARVEAACARSDNSTRELLTESELV